VRADPVGVVRAWVDACNAQNADIDNHAARALIHDDFEMTEAQVLPGAAHVRGADELLRQHRAHPRRAFDRPRARRPRNGPDVVRRRTQAAQDQLFHRLHRRHAPPRCTALANGERVWMPARLHLRGRDSGAEVSRLWQYVFTVRDGKLLRQDGYDDEAEARAAAGLDP